MRFEDREDAGRRLAELLVDYEEESPIVLGLPRGGVPVAYEVAKALNAPLDVWVVRKVGAPEYQELGVGAVAQGGVVYLNAEEIRSLGYTEETFADQIKERTAEVEARVKRFRGDRPPLELEGRTVILVDDGIATGGTVKAAIQALKTQRPKKLVLAVPVAASQSLAQLKPMVDEIVCVHSTPELYAIGAWYSDFNQVSGDEVVELLARARRPGAATATAARSERTIQEDREILIPMKNVELGGTLSLPASPVGLVLFAHGSGSSRFSPRNRYVAAQLRRHGLGTLLFDLLTRDEESVDRETSELRFDISLLARRLVEVTDWARTAPGLRDLRIGYFGSSTGAAAALVGAAERPGTVAAVVSRGGRPDLAGESLPLVQAPTLLIVGGNDDVVLELNQQASQRLQCPWSLAVIPGATHLFEEPGTLDEAARLAGEWFARHLEAASMRGATGDELR